MYNNLTSITCNNSVLHQTVSFWAFFNNTYCFALQQEIAKSAKIEANSKTYRFSVVPEEEGQRLFAETSRGIALFPSCIAELNCRFFPS